jgi:hypothetical protein
MESLRRHHHYYYRDFERREDQQRRRTTEKDLEGTELTLIEAGMVGLGRSAQLVSGTGRKMLRRTLARLPESLSARSLPRWSYGKKASIRYDDVRVL